MIALDMRIDGKIDPELADEQWDKNTDHIKRQLPRPKGRGLWLHSDDPSSSSCATIG